MHWQVLLHHRYELDISINSGHEKTLGNPNAHDICIPMQQVALEKSPNWCMHLQGMFKDLGSFGGSQSLQPRPELCLD